MRLRQRKKRLLSSNRCARSRSDTLIAVHRTFEDGAVRESFRTLRPRSGAKPARAFSFLDVEGEDDGPDEQVNLIAMTEREQQMSDFWISSGHHLLDREQGGGLLVTDEFLKLYLARPEMIPPAEACAVERTLHAALLADPRMAVSASDIAAIADADARENWQLLLEFRDYLLRHKTLEASLY